jgi:hypothetical protein
MIVRYTTSADEGKSIHERKYQMGFFKDTWWNFTEEDTWYRYAFWREGKEVAELSEIRVSLSNLTGRSRNDLLGSTNRTYKGEDILYTIGWKYDKLAYNLDNVLSLDERAFVEMGVMDAKSEFGMYRILPNLP